MRSSSIHMESLRRCASLGDSTSNSRTEAQVFFNPYGRSRCRCCNGEITSWPVLLGIRFSTLGSGLISFLVQGQVIRNDWWRRPPGEHTMPLCFLTRHGRFNKAVGIQILGMGLYEFFKEDALPATLNCYLVLFSQPTIVIMFRLFIQSKNLQPHQNGVS